MAVRKPKIPDWVRWVLSRPASELNRWQRAARYAINLARHCARELWRDKAEQMAAALTYRTIFGMVPLVVLMLLAFRAFVGLDDIRGRALEWSFDYLGLAAIEYEQIPPEAEQPSDLPAPEARDPDVEANVAARIDQIITAVAELDVAAVGGVGLAVLIFAAFFLVISLEDNFNTIYGAVRSRPYTIRIALHWTVLTLGPLLLFISFYTAGQFAPDDMRQWPVLGPILAFLSRFTALIVSWVLLFGLYVLLPNTRVHIRPAVIGSFVAAVLWEIAKAAFGVYVNTAVPYHALYGTLGLIPLFLFWVYLTWLIILFGLELTYTLQMMRGRTFDEQEEHAAKKTDELIVDPTWLIPLAARIAQSFAAGRISKLDELAQALHLPEPVVARLLHALREAHIVHPIEQDGESGYCLARPADQVTLAQLLDTRGALLPEPEDADRADDAWRLVRDIHQKEREVADARTLSDLVHHHTADEGDDADR